jgi:hypothetical protein
LDPDDSNCRPPLLRIAPATISGTLRILASAGTFDIISTNHVARRSWNNDHEPHPDVEAVLKRASTSWQVKALLDQLKGGLGTPPTIIDAYA